MESKILSTSLILSFPLKKKTPSSVTTSTDFDGRSCYNNSNILFSLYFFSTRTVVRPLTIPS